MEAEPGSGRGRRRDEALTQRLLVSALHVLMSEGYDGVTIEAVARGADASRPAVYARWPSVSDLLFDTMVFARSMAPAAVSPTELVVPDTGSLRSDLVELARQGLELWDALEAAGVLRGIIADAIRFERIGVRLRDELLVPDEVRYRAIFIRAVERGELAAFDETVADRVAKSIAGYALHRRVLTHLETSIDDLVGVVETLVSGLDGYQPRR